MNKDNPALPMPPSQDGPDENTAMVEAPAPGLAPGRVPHVAPGRVPHVAPERFRRIVDEGGSLPATRYEREELYLEEHAGPLPSARQFEHYHRIDPDASKTILTMARDEQLHRHNVDNQLLALERRDLDKGYWFRNLGQLFAFLIVAGALVAGTYLAASDKSLASFGSFMLAIGTIVALFFVRRQLDKQDRDRPKEPMTPDPSATTEQPTLPPGEGDH